MSRKSSSQILSFDKKGIPLVIVGLPQAGKTTFVRRVLTGEFEQTSTTLGMQFETTEVGDARFDIFDLGGHESYRKTIWQTYIKLAYGVIFIIDSANPESFDEAKKEFWRAMEIKGKQDEFIILFLCNKTDLEESSSLEKIINHLELFKLAEKENASFQFFKTSMKTGENIDNALNWMKNNTGKLAAKRSVKPLMFMLADIEGFPLLELDKIGLKEDPSLLSGFLSAIESFSQQLFGKKGLLQYVISGDYKYIIKTDSKFIYSMIIDIDACQEEARRLIDVICDYISNLNEFGMIESVVTQFLNIDPSEYSFKRGFL
ncbi:MAG: GTP-binding protein [Candidatus Heimdallarchaeota archaeon]|nr:GTP-binding protein [Candidatus Heimdallarchaeota archaeon]MCK4953965.1 GTP-binding protein [Candidatus Heimdallarchaeota archaeon]